MVHDPQDLTPQEEVAAAKKRLRQASHQMGLELELTADELQARAVEIVQGTRGEIQGTIDHLQERFSQTLSHTRQQISEGTTQLQEQAQQLGNQIGSALKQPLENIRSHPWEALAGAVLVGFVVGEMSSAGSAHPPPTASATPHRTHDPKQDAPSHAGVACVAGLGQTVWEVLRQDYLNPQQIRHWLHGLLGQPRREEP